MRVCYKCGGELAESYPVGICPDCILKAEECTLAVCDDFDERYEFLNEKPLKRGGQGLVFRVKDLRLRRDVALKRLADSGLDSGPARSRFIAEAQMASQLNHPGFLPIYDAGLDSTGRPFYTTVLLSGRTFRDIIRAVHQPAQNFDLELRRALQMLWQICQAAAYAHSCGLIHRDLKPTNVLIGEYGEVFVIDLGSARAVGFPAAPMETGAAQRATRRQDACATSLTPALVPAGAVSSEPPDHEPISALATQGSEVPTTLVFTPPELFYSPPGQPGPQTDVYALGVILYELCSGRQPYSLAGGKIPPDEELVKSIRRGPPAPVRQLNPAIHRDLVAVCEKAMVREPSARYATATELAADIQAFLETRVVAARRPGPVAKLHKWTLRHSRHLALATLALAAIGMALSLAWSFKIQHDHARQLNHLRAAQLAARWGQWRDALEHLRAAEQVGYANFLT